MVLEIERLNARGLKSTTTADPTTEGQAGKAGLLRQAGQVGPVEPSGPAGSAGPTEPVRRSIIFYRRQSNGTFHGRTMALAHEEQLFKIIRAPTPPRLPTLTVALGQEE